MTDLVRDHRTALLRFLPRRSEQARALAYELGRRAYADGLSLLEVCRLHQDVTHEVLEDTRPDDRLEVSGAAAALLLEVLAAYELAHPGRPRPSGSASRGGSSSP